MSVRKGVATALTLLVGLTAVACGGSSGDRKGSRGGNLTYSITNENLNGWCLPEADIGRAGTQVARALYDTLVLPDADGRMVPYLAKSIVPNDDYTRWTVTLRSGVTFSDASRLTAEVVKNNIDAYRGAYHNRKSELGAFAMANIARVRVTGPLTLEVAAKTPWPALPWALYLDGTMGIMGQAQLDDKKTCATRPVGTGPFVLRSWVKNDHLTVVRNPHYWRNGTDRKRLPYLDSITFRPIPDTAQQLNALLGNEVDIADLVAPPSGLQISTLRKRAESKVVNLTESNKWAEPQYLQLNVRKPPFNDLTARQALTAALDLNRFNDVRYNGVLQAANGPFAPGATGYLPDTGYPKYDLANARQLVAQYEERSGQRLEFVLLTLNDPNSVADAQLLQQMIQQSGAKAEIEEVDLATLVNKLLSGQFDATATRNNQGGDPDDQYHFWLSSSPLNFNGYKDPVIDRLLQMGRTTIEPAKRRHIYEELNRRFAQQVWNVWLFWADYAVASTPKVKGINSPLPDGSRPFPGLANGISVADVSLSP
jgi:peptide/nickel transport system substrate-binding protein